ncbi:MAG: hypothetical protein HY674_11100 [Chloroflexi bacterium]|nr:hypothetical protein [Chloroflexota bacterium]
MTVVRSFAVALSWRARFVSSFPGAIYHVMSRCDRREDIFLDGIQEDTAAGRQEFERHLEARRALETDGEEWKSLRRGWCLGSEEFKKQMLERMERQLRAHHSGELRRESAKTKAERIIGAELERLGGQEVELGCRLKSGPAKFAIAARLRREMTLPIKWIAARLQMGTCKSMNKKLHCWTGAHETTAITQS